MLLAGIVATDAQAATFRVPSEYPTINAGIDASAAGDTVLVAPGIYDDFEGRDAKTAAVFLKDGLTLLSEAGRDQTTIRLDGAGLASPQVVLGPQTAGAVCTMEGFEITGTAANARGLRSSGASELTLRNCRFVDLDNGVREGAGALIGIGTLNVVGCEFVRCLTSPGSPGGSHRGAGLHHGGTTLNMTACVFEDCNFQPINSWAINLTITDTIFRGNVGPATVRGDWCTLEGCSFLDTNSLGASWGNHWAGALDIDADRFSRVRGCVFSGNVGFRAGALQFRGAGAIAQNTFVGNQGPSGSACEISVQFFVAFRRNVVVENFGSPAISAFTGSDPRVLNGTCNLYWDNPSGDGTGTAFEIQTTDFFLDPQFCDPAGGDFTVAVSSPCLPENNTTACLQRIGARGLGCGPGSETVVALRTNPEGVQVVGDNVAQTDPALFGWVPGTTHMIAATPFDDSVPDVRHTFDSWSDGGANSHSIVVPGSHIELTANYLSEYVLTTMAYEGGSVTAGGWTDGGSMQFVNAIADSGWRFSAWVGTGEGSYTGNQNPAVALMLGPITQVAAFNRIQDDLTMAVLGNGTVSPGSGVFDRGSTVTIEAFPDSAWGFVEWIGEGALSYSGPDNPATILMNSSITQTAVFRDITPDLTMIAGTGGTVTPETGPQTLNSLVAIEATPDNGYAFFRWVGIGVRSYSGTDNPAEVKMRGPITETATFHPTLTVSAESGGTVTPAGGAFPPGTAVEIEATSDGKHLFREWLGTGSGSYSGTDSVATITVDDPTNQVAHFDPIRYEIAISLSDTDPNVSTGPPIGLGKVYLWLVCGTVGGLTGLDAEVSGSLNPVAFTPSSGILNSGSATSLSLGAGSCITGPALLGEFLVLAPGDGTLCIADVEPALVVTNCALPGVAFAWPEDVRFTGVSTTAAAPCAFGQGCTPDLTMIAGNGGTVIPETGPQPLDSLVTIEATPDDGYAFFRWDGVGGRSYSGADNPAEVEMLGPITETATFHPTLTVSAETGGSVTPAGGVFPPGTVVEIEATSDGKHLFREWRGSGTGSYSGSDSLATITVDDPTTQVAHFDPIGYEIAISFSDTDPHVSTGPPIGFGKAYLWLVCGTMGGLTGLDAEISGSLSPVAFTPSPGILNSGSATSLGLGAGSCITGPALLGEFLILSPGDGTLCVSDVESAPALVIANCGFPGVDFAWPENVKFTGISTTAAPPCDFGRGCDDALPGGNTPVGIAQTTPRSLPTADGFESVVPNPFLNGTTIRFALRAPSQVSLTVFDVSGRRVRTLVNRTQEAGTHTVTWDGRNESGRELPASVYFLRLETSDYTGTRKLILLGQR